MHDQNTPPFVTTGTYPTRAGNAAKLLVDGEPAFRRVCQTIEAAQHSVWATVTFMWPEFRMPDGRGTALEVLDRAARRGVDVRLIFWRPDLETASHRRNAFWGAPEHFAALRTMHPRLSVRWDRAQAGFCQHQKTWLIDAGEDSQIAFLGGLNLNPHSMVAPGHRGEGQNHDLYIELAGPAVADVHHNFVQRWNEASERLEDEGRWGKHADNELAFPARLPTERGNVTMQIQRTIHANRYQDGRAPIHGRAFNIVQGERTNLDQYLAAIRTARRTIYMENQYLELAEIVEALHGALARGVEVVVLLPILLDVAPTPDPSPERQAFLEARAGLGEHSHFTLAGMAGPGADGRRKPVWVHSKLMLIDDVWATVGSANLHRYSMFGNAELNVAMRSHETVQGFRVALFEEHLGLDTSGLDDLTALRAFKRVARANREKLMRQDADWQGLAVALDVWTYGQIPDAGW